MVDPAKDAEDAFDIEALDAEVRKHFREGARRKSGAHGPVRSRLRPQPLGPSNIGPPGFVRDVYEVRRAYVRQHGNRAVTTAEVATAMLAEFQRRWPGDGERTIRLRVSSIMSKFRLHTDDTGYGLEEVVFDDKEE